MFTLPDLPYAYNALEPSIDEATMKLHHDKHHAAYITNVNDALKGNDALEKLTVEQLLQNLHKVPEEIRTKVRNNAGGHYNHSLFWQIMAPQTSDENEPTGKVVEAINTSFGSFAMFQEQFAKAALGRFGSGWVWLVVEPTAGGQHKLVLVDTPNQDSPIMERRTPIVGLDVWEHAYYLKYQNRRVDYITAWWRVVNWPEVGRRFASVVAA